MATALATLSCIVSSDVPESSPVGFAENSQSEHGDEHTLTLLNVGTLSVLALRAGASSSILRHHGATECIVPIIVHTRVEARRTSAGWHGAAAYFTKGAEATSQRGGCCAGGFRCPWASGWGGCIRLRPARRRGGPMAR